MQKDNSFPVYCDGIIEEFSVEIHGNNCIERVSDIIRREGGKCSKVFDNKKALNLDLLESKLAGKNTAKSVDMTLGCRNNTLVMIEAKFRVQSIDNHFVSEIKQKFSQSRLRLNTSESFSIHPKGILLFDKHSYQQNKNRFMSFMMNDNQFVPLTVSSFYDKVFKSQV